MQVFVDVAPHLEKPVLVCKPGTTSAGEVVASVERQLWKFGLEIVGLATDQAIVADDTTLNDLGSGSVHLEAVLSPASRSSSSFDSPKAVRFGWGPPPSPPTQKKKFFPEIPQRKSEIPHRKCLADTNGRVVHQRKTKPIRLPPIHRPTH